MSNLYGNMKFFLEYNAIICAIPKSWIKIINNDNNKEDNQENCDDNTLTDKLKTILKISKWAYMMLNPIMNVATDSSREKWSHILGINIDEDEWKGARLLMKKNTISVKLRDFQYRLLTYRTDH